MNTPSMPYSFRLTLLEYLGALMGSQPMVNTPVTVTRAAQYLATAAVNELPKDLPMPEFFAKRGHDMALVHPENIVHALVDLGLLPDKATRTLMEMAEVLTMHAEGRMTTAECLLGVQMSTHQAEQMVLLGKVPQGALISDDNLEPWEDAATRNYEALTLTFQDNSEKPSDLDFSTDNGYGG